MVTRRRRLRAISIGVLAVWAAALAWHVRREYFAPLSERLASASARLVPANSFYTIKLGGEPIGYASSRIDTLSDGFLLEDDMRLRVRALGSNVPAMVRTRAMVGRDLDLRDFQFRLSSELGDFAVSGEMEGDSLLRLSVSAGGETQEQTLETRGPILLPQVMPIHLVLGSEPEPGSSYAYEVFDPSILERQRITLRVVGRETLIYPDSVEFDADSRSWVTQRSDTVETWRVLQSFGGIELETWLDGDGLVVKATSPLGYSIERTAFEIAWNDYRALEGRGVIGSPDIIESTAISVGIDLPEGDRLERLAVRLKGVDLEGFDLHGERQSLRGDTLIVALDAGAPEPGYSLPASAERWPDELGATPLVQADDQEIVQVAGEIVGGTKDPLVAAERLSSWVYENLEKRVTVSVPSARQVLDARRGDCNEHTVLFVALARAAGLPARPVAGLVYVNGRFYYHAWPEVWLGRWVPADPTLGQFPADASHIRFVVGGLARQVELVRLVGSLELDVIDVEERR